MSEAVRVGQETETPINPYSLLEAVNNSSDTAHTAWLIFLGLMTYLMIAVAGVTHRDLLLETPVALPLLQVSIQQSQFFQFAPILLVLFHLGVVSQLVLLARKTLEFDRSVRRLEATELRTHPLRLELDNFFFVQAVAGPHRSYVMSAFLHGMSWLTLVVLPVILLLFVQIRYLPFHDVTVTWAHRIALVADIGMLVLIGIFLTRAETSFPAAFWRSGRDHPLTFLGTTMLLAVVAFFSFFVATIPGETLDRMAGNLGWAGGQESVSPAGVRLASQAISPSATGFSLPFAAARADGTLFGVFHRNLMATDHDLAPAKDGRSGENSLVLRGRDLRYARLDRTDFHGADLTNVDLDGASLVGANLNGVRMQCADINELYLSDNRATARCASARGANFTRAKLKEARLAGIDGQGARFEEANLEAADLSYAVLSGANFSSAHLGRTDFSGGAQLQGTNFLLASMQGADLSGAMLFLADFSSAQMQAVLLSHADLHGALLRDADLEGADLGNAKLQGADLSRARLTAADLRDAAVWMSSPGADEALGLADLSQIVVKPLDAMEVARLKGSIDKIVAGPLQSQMREGLAGIMNIADSQKWSGSMAALKWRSQQALASGAGGERYKGLLTEQLARLMCRTRWSSGAVATGVAKRALGQTFRGDIGVIYDRLRSSECPAAESVSRKTLRDLADQVEIARGN